MLEQLFSRLTPIQRSLLSAIAGLVAYGAWAYWVNVMHGADKALMAACVQGGYSFALTFVMTILIEGIYRQFANTPILSPYRRVATVLTTCAIIFSLSWWVNAMAGTPEIFRTVILGYFVGGIFTVGYVGELVKESQKNIIR